MKSVFTFSALILFAISAQAQNFVEQEPFHLINIGNGAAALGMAGAYVAIADDLSAFSWNPAGLSNKTGFRMQFDSVYTTGSENFEVTTFRSGTTLHDYSVNGFQPQAVALTYQTERNNIVFGPAFAWSRATLNLHDYKMDAPATGHFTSGLFFIDADYSWLNDQTYDRGGEDIYSFGFSAKIKNHFAVGAVWNMLGGESTHTTITHSTASGTRLFVFPDQESIIGPFSSTADYTSNSNEKYSGNFLNVGILYQPNSKVALGSAVRFRYTRKVESSFADEVNLVVSGLSSSAYHSTSELGGVNLQSEIPIEFSGGVAVRISARLLAASSFTFADYTLDDKPPGDIDFPTNHDFFQSTLIQWRNGLEFQANDYLSVRGGFIIDDQPYTLQYYPVNEPDDSPFYGFTLGTGWRVKNFGFDVAFLHETGHALSGFRLGGISDHDVEFTDAHANHNRLFFTFKFQQ